MTLGDKESNPFRFLSDFALFFSSIISILFSLGIAVRFPYGEFDIRTRDPETEKVQIGSFDDKQLMMEKPLSSF